MTATLQRAQGQDSEGEILWRQLNPSLWVATRNGYGFGTIERGRRFTALDETAEIVGRYDTLELAMTALAERPAR